MTTPTTQREADERKLLGFDIDDLSAIADGLEAGYEKSIDVGGSPLDGNGPNLIASTTAVAARFIRAAIDQSTQQAAPIPLGISAYADENGQTKGSYQQAASEAPTAATDQPSVDGLSPTYEWLGHATKSGIAEVEHAARTMMAYYQGAEFPDQPSAGQWTVEKQDDMGIVCDAAGKRITSTYYSDAKRFVDAHNASLTPTAPIDISVQEAARQALAEMERLPADELQSLLDHHKGGLRLELPDPAITPTAPQAAPITDAQVETFWNTYNDKSQFSSMIDATKKALGAVLSSAPQAATTASAAAFQDAPDEFGDKA
jgi:hypothetical protein